MARQDPARRVLALGLRYTPRVVAGAAALLSLLLSHQLIRTEFAYVLAPIAVPHVWLSTNIGQPTMLDEIFGNQLSKVTTDPNLDVSVIAPPDRIVALMANGAPIFMSRRAAGLSEGRLQLRRGDNVIVAGVWSADDRRRIDWLRTYQVTYQSRTPLRPTLVAWRPSAFAADFVDVLGFGEPGAFLYIRTGSTDAPPSTAVADQIGSFTTSLLVPPNGPVALYLSNQIGAVAAFPPGPTEEVRSFARTGQETGYQILTGNQTFSRNVSLQVNGGVLTVRASADLPADAPFLEMAQSRLLTGGEFLRRVFGLCFMSDDLEQLGSLWCGFSPYQALTLDTLPEVQPNGHVDFRADIPLSSELTLVRWLETSLGQSFLSLPGDELRVNNGAPGVNLHGRRWQAEGTAQVRRTDPARTDDDVFEADTVVLTVAAAQPAAAAPQRPPDQTRAIVFIDRIRGLERNVPERVRELFNQLLTAIPFLYLLWILRSYPVEPASHGRTLRAVILTFLVLHLSIVAAQSFEASFTTRGVELLPLTPESPWVNAARQALQSARYLDPFLAIAVVVLVGPMFRAFRRMRQAPRWPTRAARGLGWVAFWMLALAIPVGAAWALGKIATATGLPERLGVLGGTVAFAFMTLWFVLFWLMRGVLRIGIETRHAVKASWAMLALPFAPIAADGGTALVRSVFVTQTHVYPFILPEQLSPYIAPFIVMALGAVLLRQTSELTVRMSQNRDVYRWWRRSRFLIVCVALVIAFPVPGGEGTDVFRITRFLGLLDNLLPYAVLIGAFHFLHLLNRTDSFEIPDAAVHVGALLFAYYVTRGSAALLFVPVPFLIAFWLFHRWLIVPCVATVPLTTPILDTVLKERRARSRLDSLQKGLDKKFGDGDLKLVDYTARLEEARQAADQLRDELRAQTADTEPYVFSRGPESGPWENAKIAVRYGIVISLPFQIFTLLGMLRSEWGAGVFPLMEFGFAAVYSVVTWVVMAAVFGYFFHRIRGRNGFEKALSFSLCAVIPLFPLRLLSEMAVLRGQVIDIVQIVAFTLVLALTAFDLRTLQKHRFGWRDLMAVYGLASAAYGSTIAVAVASALGGTDILKTVASYLMKSLGN
jgi:hypothetical protein